MEKGMNQAHQHHGGVSHKWLHLINPKEGWMQPHKQALGETQSMAKPGSREANIGTKHRNKQEDICMNKENDQNPLI